MNVSHVARLCDIKSSLLFKWKKQYQERSLTAVVAEEEVVSPELATVLKPAQELQRRSIITMKTTRTVRWDIILQESTGDSGHS